MIGKMLGHYHIIEKLGEGGMGVVYRARDTHLDRFVAVKVLPPERVADPERKRRFVQEARAASALNHPNIITIHDIDQTEGINFIAMEYVPGKTLDDLIPRKGMRLSQALKFAVQIADALARAHAAGIIHRDLKPSNVMVDEHGLVKVLDFGLAKLTEVSGPEDETAATHTGAGTILGTAAYMSPEQAEGKLLDARSDIFSFGSVLYEMVTGRRAFQGDSKMSTLSAVLHREPEPLLDEVPRELARIINRCLRKDPDRRFQHVDDLKVALEELKEESESGSLAAPARIRADRARRRALTALIAVGAFAAGWWLWKAASPRDPYGAIRETPFTADAGLEMYPSFSPDGLSVVYQKMPPTEQWGPDSPPVSVMVKMIGSESTAVLKENAISPVWSPDGRWIAFGRRRNWFTPETAVFVMPRIGGTERTIADLSQAPGSAAGSFVAWTPDSKGLITTDRERPGAPLHLVLVSLDSGEKQPLTTPPSLAIGDIGPALSPDGRTLAFCRRTIGTRVGYLYLLDLDAAYRPTASPRKLETGLPLSNWPVWTRDGREIVFCSGAWSGSTLWRIRADGSGPARRLPFGGQGAFQPNLAPAGDRLVYMKQTWDTDIWRIELLPSGLPAGAPEKFIASSRPDFGAAWSPDGRSIAFVSQRTGRAQIWVCDFNCDGQRQLTSMESRFGIEGGVEMEPVWSPDSEWIAFSADEAAGRDIYLVGLRGGALRRLTADPAADYDPQWSADGRYVYFRSNRSGEDRVWKVAREGGTATPDSDPGGVRGYSLRSQGGGFSIWREPAGAGAAVMLVDGVAERGFAATGKGIYYVPRGPEPNPWYTGIAFLDYAGGRSIKVADLRTHQGVWAGTSPSVSPDGRYLLYTKHSVDTNDLMMVENFR